MTFLVVMTQQRNYLCNNSEFSCRIYVFVAKHEDLGSLFSV